MAQTEAQKRAHKKWREKNMEKVLEINRNAHKRNRRKRYEKVVDDIIALDNDKEKILDYVSEHLQIKGGRQWGK